MASSSLGGFRIGVTAERRGEQQIKALELRGAEVLWAPMMSTIDLSGDEALSQVTDALIESPPEVLVLLTGMGLRFWLEAAEQRSLRDKLLSALGGARVLARGPKAASEAKRSGLRVDWVAGSERSPEVIAHLQGLRPVAGAVAVQLDGLEHDALLMSAREISEVVEVPVYRWAMPTDMQRSVEFINSVIAGELDAVTFTASPAVRMMFEIAAKQGLKRDLREAFSRTLGAAVGPVCRETMQDQGIERIVMPERFRTSAMLDVMAAELAIQ